MQVLVALAQARPTVVSRDKLVEQCWEGRIVGDDSLNRCILALRHLAEEFDPKPFTIDTVPRIGHRLVENVPEGCSATPQPANTRPWLLVLLLVSLLAAVGLFAWQQRVVEPEPVSIAVLPFRNLSNGDPYFAEGVSEEILNQLAREPAFRVAGRAFAAQLDEASNPREVGRKLGVDYVLEGSVRSGQGRVRINASLVKTGDGMRLWSETYDRKLEDVLAIQTAIGEAVANGLSLRLVHSGIRGTRPINGEAYALYLNARGLLRSQSPQVGSDAVTLLQQAIRLDPNFAPAWSSLAEAMQLKEKANGADALINILPRAQAAARKALQLDPNLAQAHGVLGTLVPAREAGMHLRRAAKLDPRSGEGLIWLSEANYVSGDYAGWLTALRRAHDIDPLWPFPLRALIDVSSVMADRPATEAIVRRGFPDDPMVQQFALGRVAWTYGDYSEAARRWSIVASEPGSRFAPSAQLSLDDLKFMLNLSSTRPSRPPTPRPGRIRWGPSIWMTAPPSPTEWQNRNRSAAAALVNLDENIVAAKLMLNAGRARELAATYDSPTGLLNVRRGEPLSVCLEEAAISAVALRDAGRGDEADALLREADGVLQILFRGSQVPSWLYWEAASVWALQGKTGAAVEALERSLQRGWVHGRRGDLPNLKDEPAVRSLRGDPRFKAVLARYEAHFSRERQETVRDLNLPVRIASSPSA
jgi:TolB-like protein/tetratricopeptide (TPR) repeat protein